LRELKRRNPDVKVVVPKLFTRKMVTDLKYCGIDAVIELPHAGSMTLGQDFLLHSYQFDVATDSCAVVTAGDTTLFNVNDCKIFGAPLRQILSRHPIIDFVFRSHSSATAIPYCVEGYDRDFTEIRSKLDYIRDFCSFATHVGARYAVPFASNHCFLHQDTMPFNKMIVSPIDVQHHFNATIDDSCGTECIVMPPGSSWSRDRGFNLVDFDYADQENQIARLNTKYQAVLSAQYATEKESMFDQTAFEKYFSNLFVDIPKMLRRNLPKTVFRVLEGPSKCHCLEVDFAAGRITRRPDDSASTGLTIEIAAHVLNGCVRMHMFNVLAPSKRLCIRLPANDKVWLGQISRILSLLSWHDQDYFPVRNNLTTRSLAVRFRRWRDFYEYSKVFTRYRLLKRPVVTSDLWPARQR
jgi:UDP-MurNAc hydroxylase